MEVWVKQVGGSTANATISQAHEFMRARLDAGISHNTVKTELSTLKAIYNFSIETNSDQYTNNPFHACRIKARLAQPRKQADVVPDEYVSKMIRKAQDIGEFAHMCISLQFATGWRVSEVLALQWHQVILSVKPEYVIQEDTKTHLIRKQPLPSWCVGILKKYERIDGKVVKFSQSYAWKLWQYLVKECKLPHGNYTTHSARVTAISKLVREGYSHADVLDFSGHHSVSMIEKYDRRMRQLEDNIGRRISYEK